MFYMLICFRKLGKGFDRKMYFIIMQIIVNLGMSDQFPGAQLDHAISYMNLHILYWLVLIDRCLGSATIRSRHMTVLVMVYFD